MSEFEQKPFVSPESLSLVAGNNNGKDSGGGGNAAPYANDATDQINVEKPSAASIFDAPKEEFEDGLNGLKRKFDDLGADNVIDKSISPQLQFYNLKSGICYDVRMRYHCKIVTSPNEYDDPHPEDPRRIYRIYKAIAEAGLVQDATLQGSDDLGPLMQKVPVRECRDEEVLMVHTQRHLDYILSTESMSREQLITETNNGDSIYLSNDTLASARLSCGGSIEICKAVIERQVKNGIAVVRPPGHHAEPHVAGGFCLFSNVAVASKVMLKDYPEKVRRILILDWDVHHGNGTQRAFLDDPNVLYISLHRHENGAFYPGGPFGGHTVVGDGAGAGFSVNIPWSRAGMGDGDYVYAFQKVVMPIAFEFDPDLVIISAGFDAAAGDHLGGCFVSPSGYGQMTHMLMQLASGHVAVVLEGGYNLQAISRSAVAVTKVLLGDPPGIIETKLPSESAIRDVDDVIRVQSRYWKSLRPSNMAIAPVTVSQDCDKLSQVVRTHQALDMIRHKNMAPLPLFKSNSALLVDMQYQVMASENIHSKNVILFIVHDTPEVWAKRDPILGTIETAGSKVIDSADMFVKFGLDNGYGVVDVAIPGFKAGSGESSSNTNNNNQGSDSGDETAVVVDDDEPRFSPVQCAQETLVYLWDNYVEYFDASKIVFVGLGHAYYGIVHLAGHRQAIKKRTSSILSFVGSAKLKAVEPLVDEYTVEWFYKNSIVFTSENHAAWDTSINPKKPRKKFGRVMKGDAVGVYQLAAVHFDDATEYIQEHLESDGEDDENER